jgi:hypothetical protein
MKDPRNVELAAALAQLAGATNDPLQVGCQAKGPAPASQAHVATGMGEQAAAEQPLLLPAPSNSAGSHRGQHGGAGSCRAAAG